MKPELKTLLWALAGGGVFTGIYFLFFRATEASPEASPESLMPVVPDLMKNEVPAFAHVTIGPGLYLRTNAGNAFIAMRTAARAVGIDIPVSTAYRSLAWQTKLRAAYEAHLAGGPWAPLASRPDGNGPHQRGLAVDLNGFDKSKSNFNAARNLWMQANAASYGWHQTGLTFAMKEPWHWYFKGSSNFPVA